MASQWKIFAEALETYLGQLRGSGRVPLNYIICHTAVNSPEEAYETDQARLVALAPLNGPSYQRDNAKVYGIIKQLVLEGPGRTFILCFDAAADGRAAWLALWGHYEGIGFKNRNVDEAYSQLDHLTYSGEKKGFTFEKFVQRHMESFLELARFNEPILETKKVRDFLGRITVPELQASVQQVKATAALMTDFEQAANFISLSVQPLKSQTRTIGSINVDQARRQRGYRPSRGGGRQHFRIGRGRQGRGGRGFPHGHQVGRGRQGQRNSRGINTGYYTPEEWQSLTPDQRTLIMDTRSSVDPHQQGDTNRRQISQVVVDNSAVIEDAASALTSPTVHQQSHPIGGNAGNQFGQRSRTIGMI